MFSRNKTPAADKAGPGRAAGGKPGRPIAPSILSENIRVTGNIETDGDVQVDGIVDGDVRSRTLVVGVAAVVNGAISADTVRVAGTVNGQITARVVELRKSARVTGDVLHQSLSIDAGAFVHGLCKHVDEESRRGAVRPSLVVADGGDGGTAAG